MVNKSIRALPCTIGTVQSWTCGVAGSSSFFGNGRHALPPDGATETAGGGSPDLLAPAQR